MKFRLTCLAVFILGLSACASHPKPSEASLGIAKNAESANAFRGVVTQATINAWLSKPVCNYATYPVQEGQPVIPECLNAWALNLAHAIYQNNWDQVSLYRDPTSWTSVADLKNLDLLKQAQSGTVHVIGEPVWNNQAVGQDGAYFWLLEIPVSVKSNTKISPQLLRITIQRTHTPNTLGFAFTRILVKPLGDEKLALAEYQATKPYVAVNHLYAKPYAPLIYLDNPVDAKVVIYQGNTQIFSQMIPAGPHSIPTDSFPSGHYAAKMVMTSDVRQFSREEWVQIDKV